LLVGRYLVRFKVDDGSILFVVRVSGIPIPYESRFSPKYESRGGTVPRRYKPFLYFPKSTERHRLFSAGKQERKSSSVRM
jgi:hypothetical protein